MSGNPLLSIVIPVYDEEQSLPPLLEELLPAAEAVTEDFEVIFVNDGSRDGSGRVLRGFLEIDSRTGVLEMDRNHGVSAAIEGSEESVRAWIRAVRTEPPAGARIESVAAS